MRILVVDDDPIVLASCERILGDGGHEVIEAKSVEEGLEALRSGRLDLLILDVIMPEHDGFVMMDTVRRDRPDLPILVMSGYPTQEVMARGMGMGAVRFLSKPFSPEELIEAVQTATTGSPGKEQ